MRVLLVCLIPFITLNSFSKSYPRDSHVVVSDELKDDVKKGACRVVGVIYDGPYLLPNGLVSNLDRSRSGVSNEKGEYSFMLSSSDTAIFFFKEGYNEQVIWSYDFKSGHEVRIDFYAGQNIIIDAVDKPVIYLYSEKDLTASVSPNFKGDLTFTYPTLNDHWEVEINNNELYESQTGKKYPYLFWEGEMKNLSFLKNNNPISGSIVMDDDIVPFLEKNLETMGFNEKEMSDFITFWGPKMAQRKYSFVQFLENSAVDETIGELSISPQPDNLKRVYMLFKSYDVMPDVEHEPQTFEAFDRSGFTVLEWGGTQLKTQKK